MPAHFIAHVAFLQAYATAARRYSVKPQNASTSPPAFVSPSRSMTKSATSGSSFRDPLHNSGETVTFGSGWALRRRFAARSTVIGKKNNAADSPSPSDHRPQGVMQRILRSSSIKSSIFLPSAKRFSRRRSWIDMRMGSLSCRKLKRSLLRPYLEVDLYSAILNSIT